MVIILSNMVLAFLFTHTFAGSGKEPFTQIASYFTGTRTKEWIKVSWFLK